MKTRNALIVGFFLLVIAAVVLIQRERSHRVPAVETETNNAEAVLPSAPPYTNPVWIVEHTESNQVPLTQEQKLEQLKQTMQNYSDQLHRPIEFYGMVVDENNSVVAGANINLVWTHYMLPETTYDTNILSDANGMFSISGITGADLDVDVSKDGYYPVKSQNPTKFAYSETYGSHPFRPDSGNPVVFHLRKKGQGVNLIASEFDVPTPLNGTPIVVDILNHQVGQNGQIEISQVKPDHEHWRQANEWKFSITIQDGGFIGENDEFPFEAPESGYQPTVEFDFRQGDPDWTANLRTNFYIKFGNPPLYGHLNLATFIDSSDARLTYAINPDGSRNLEPK